jgi:hypothetical protein
LQVAVVVERARHHWQVAVVVVRVVCDQRSRQQVAVAVWKQHYRLH